MEEKNVGSRIEPRFLSRKGQSYEMMFWVDLFHGSNKFDPWLENLGLNTRVPSIM